MQIHAPNACMGLSAEKKVCVVLIAALFNQPEDMARPIFYVVVRLLRGDMRPLLCRCMYKVYRLNPAAFIGWFQRFYKRPGHV